MNSELEGIWEHIVSSLIGGAKSSKMKISERIFKKDTRPPRNYQLTTVSLLYA